MAPQWQCEYTPIDHNRRKAVNIVMNYYSKNILGKFVIKQHLSSIDLRASNYEWLIT